MKNMDSAWETSEVVFWPAHADAYTCRYTRKQMYPHIYQHMYTYTQSKSETPCYKWPHSSWKSMAAWKIKCKKKILTSTTSCYVWTLGCGLGNLGLSSSSSPTHWTEYLQPGTCYTKHQTQSLQANTKVYGKWSGRQVEGIYVLIWSYRLLVNFPHCLPFHVNLQFFSVQFIYFKMFWCTNVIYTFKCHLS